MRDNETHHDPVGVSRNVIKTTPNRITALWLFGIFILASATFIGVQIGIFLNGGLTDAAYWDGLFTALGVASTVGFMTIVVQENGQDIKVKIVREQ
jgi:ABC-type multidrug transport system permease subunit